MKTLDEEPKAKKDDHFGFAILFSIIVGFWMGLGVGSLGVGVATGLIVLMFMGSVEGIKNKLGK